MQQRAHIHVSGRVQGVGFRMSAAQEATDLELTGYVRNLDSGDVELVAEGDPDAIAEIIAWCHHGPPMSHITRVTVTRSKASGEYDGFSIR